MKVDHIKKDEEIFCGCNQFRSLVAQVLWVLNYNPGDIENVHSRKAVRAFQSNVRKLNVACLLVVMEIGF